MAIVLVVGQPQSSNLMLNQPYMIMDQEQDDCSTNM